MSWNLRCSWALGCAAKERGKELSLLPDAADESCLRIILTIVINQVLEAELPLSAFPMPGNIRVLLFSLLMSQQGQGVWVVWAFVSALSMGLLCQRSRRDGRNPPPGAFKQFPLLLNRVWHRSCSEDATELRCLEKWVEEHI